MKKCGVVSRVSPESQCHVGAESIDKGVCAGAPKGYKNSITVVSADCGRVVSRLVLSNAAVAWL